MSDPSIHGSISRYLLAVTTATTTVWQNAVVPSPAPIHTYTPRPTEDNGTIRRRRPWPASAAGPAGSSLGGGFLSYGDGASRQDTWLVVLVTSEGEGDQQVVTGSANQAMDGIVDGRVAERPMISNDATHRRVGSLSRPLSILAHPRRRHHPTRPRDVQTSGRRTGFTVCTRARKLGSMLYMSIIHRLQQAMRETLNSGGT